MESRRLEGRFLKVSLPFLVFFHLSSCVNKPEFTDLNSSLVNKLENLIKVDGGFTFNLPKNKEVEQAEGYAVSLDRFEIKYPADCVSSVEIAEFFVNHKETLMDPNNNFGAWFDEEAGEVYFDVSRIIPDSFAAVKFAYFENQKAIYDLMRGTTIEIDKKDKKAL